MLNQKELLKQSVTLQCYLFQENTYKYTEEVQLQFVSELCWPISQSLALGSSMKSTPPSALLQVFPGSFLEYLKVVHPASFPSPTHPQFSCKLLPIPSCLFLPLGPVDCDFFPPHSVLNIKCLALHILFFIYRGQCILLDSTKT